MSTTFWDNMAKSYDNNINKHDLAYQKTLNTLASLLTESDVVLDFACATGEQSLDVAPYVQRVHGIDFSSKMIAVANQKAGDRQVSNINFDAIDVFDDRLISQSYTAIIAFNIFHLLDDPSKALARLNDLLPSGGLLISQTPCLGEIGWLFRNVLGFAGKLGLAPKIHNFTYTELTALVSSNQFEIIDSQIWDEDHAVRWIVARKH